MSMIDGIKVSIRILKIILAFVVLMVLMLGIIGGGWGPKQVVEGHPFYSGNRMLIAHRGASDKVPENTFASAERAVQLGFTAIEVDIKQSSDGQLYLFHDRESTRLFGQDLPLNELTLSQLQRLDLYHNGKKTQHRVPELELFTLKVSSELNLYLDIKRHGNYQYQRLSARIADLLRRHHLTNSSLVGSDFLFTAYLEYRFPEIHTVFTGPGDWTIAIYSCIPKKFRPDFIISYANEITPQHLKWLQRQGLVHRRMVYGVNGSNYEQVKQWNIPILVVDYDPVMDADLMMDADLR